ncbi:MAG: hypothetical protein ACLTW9_01020 [Enterocloster sp.]
MNLEPTDSGMEAARNFREDHRRRKPEPCLTGWTEDEKKQLSLPVGEDDGAIGPGCGGSRE